jgi:cardiolipin synthase
MTTLLVDAHAFLIKSKVTDAVPGPLWFARKLSDHLPEPYGYRLQSLRSLGNQSSGEYAIINPPSRRFRLPIAGRSHIKLAVIDNTIFIGGYNLQSPVHIDMMVSLTDKNLADWLYNLFKKVQADKQVWRVLAGRDLSRQVDGDTQLLIDAGKPNQSIVLKSAIDLIDEAKEWILITCQFFPNSQTAAALTRAHKRGVKVEIIFSHPNMHGFVGSVAHRANMLRERLRVPNHFFDGMLAKTNTMLHAKLLATDCGTMIGSHNFVQAGVHLGTAEIALYSRNSNFTSQALAALERAQAV